MTQFVQFKHNRIRIVLLQQPALYNRRVFGSKIYVTGNIADAQLAVKPTGHILQIKIICLVKRRRTEILYLVQIDIIAMLMLMQYCIGQVYRILHLIIIIHPFINVILIRPRLHLCQTALSPDSEKAIGYAPLQISL